MATYKFPQFKADNLNYEGEANLMEKALEGLNKYKV